MDWIWPTKPRIWTRQEDSCIQGLVFQKSFPHKINVLCLLEGLEMIKRALLIFCRTSRCPSQICSQFSWWKNVCQSCCLQTCSMKSGKRFCCCGCIRETYWITMENYLQDHNLWESWHLIALWGWRSLRWWSLCMVWKHTKICYGINLQWEWTCTSWQWWSFATTSRKGRWFKMKSLFSINIFNQWHKVHILTLKRCGRKWN